MRKRRPPLLPLAGAMVSWAKEQTFARKNAGMLEFQTPPGVDGLKPDAGNAGDGETDLLAVSALDGPSQPGEASLLSETSAPSQPDILDVLERLEGNGLVDEDLDVLPANIDLGPGNASASLGLSSVVSVNASSSVRNSFDPDVVPVDSGTDLGPASLDHSAPSRDLGLGQSSAATHVAEAIVPALASPSPASPTSPTSPLSPTSLSNPPDPSSPLSTPSTSRWGKRMAERRAKQETKRKELGAPRERRQGNDRRNLALAVVPGLVPTRLKRIGPGRVFDQESPGLSLPDRYENPDPSASVAVQPLWHLPAPFDRVRLGLRARATLALALGSLVISVLVSTLTFLVARSSFVDAQRTSVVKVVNTHVEAVQSAVSKATNVRLVLINQDAEAILVRADGNRDNNKLLLEDVPRALQTLLESKASAASQIVETPEGKRLFVGIKLPGLDGAKFFERATLGDVERKVNSLGRTLALVTALSTLGAALVGRSVARQVVRPLRNVADAAAEISSGRLDTRLQRSGDVDLDPLLASFNNMAATLQQRVEREGRFASDVSHELRTPLTALSTAAQLLQGRRDEFSERSQRAVDVLVSQTQHFERLVLDLLEISRFDAGAAEIHREVLHLPEFVRLVVAINSPFVDGDGARVQIPVDDSEMIYPEVSLDKRRVERVVANLLQNAANYGGGAVGVSLADVTENDQPYVRIAVEDDGPGVPDAEKTAIFERFARGQATKGNANSPKGTGLGLALVSAHVALHEGRVWVEDREHGGARFVALFAVEERVAPDAEDVA
jgi:two-component system, OmpR family, sensor histidine kinase MtrB